MYEPKRQFTYKLTTDEDQVLLDMIQYFSDLGLPDHIDSKAFESLSDKFFSNIQEIIMSYTKNETALLTLISNINNQFYYIGEEDDKVAPIDVKKFTEYCVAFIDNLEIDND